MVKNDSACGSTIGPMMAAKAGIKTVDIGAPMLGMHSIRETCGVIDLLHYRRLFTSFFVNYSSIPTELLSEWITEWGSFWVLKLTNFNKKMFNKHINILRVFKWKNYWIINQIR